MADATLSPELKAMAALEHSMADLAVDAQQRILRWATERFGLALPSPPRAGSDHSTLGAKSKSDREGIEAPGAQAETLAEFYDQTGCSTDADKVLVVSYWFQYRQGMAEIEARQVNAELKHLGHGIGNVTRAFETLKGQKPAPIVQTRKDGSTKQAQKKFKVTSEGKKVVEKMLLRDSRGT